MNLVFHISEDGSEIEQTKMAAYRFYRVLAFY